jgi:deazaflavin-dependent oxidoreductase (nitroreductase family)
MTEIETAQLPASMTYPRRGTLNRVLFKIPLVLWRMGLGPLLSHPALGGSKMLALTTWGRVSKLPRSTMLSYTLFEGRPYVASGWGLQSDWVRNLVADPAVRVQVGRESFSGLSYRVVDEAEFRGVGASLFASGGDSHFEDWLTSLGIDYDLNDLVDKRERVYMVGFDPGEVEAPPPVKADLVWAWVMIPLLALGWWLLRR